jgi:phage terminase large subunit
MEQIEKVMNLTPVQRKALDILQDNETTSLIYGGGAGGGKSYLGCYWILKMCMKYEGTRWLIGRKERTTLKNTTLESFWNVCSLMGFNRDEHFTYREQANRIEFTNGSTILLMDLQYQPSDPNYDALGGLELTGAFVDECNQITEKAWNILRSRIRYKLTDFQLKPKILGTCNPAKNWVYTQYYKPSVDMSMEPKKKFLQALITDNPMISEDYVELLREMPKAERERLLEGKWELEDETALMAYDSILDIFTNNHVGKDSNVRTYISCDVAAQGKDKAVILVWRGLEIIEMEVFDKSDLTELQTSINVFKTRYNVSNSNIVVDGDGLGRGLWEMIKGSKSFGNGTKALYGANHRNLKTQCYYKLSEYVNASKIYFNAELTSKEKENIIEELEQVRYKETDSDGKLMIIGKKEVKANIGRSPDYSDAIMMRMFFELGDKKVHGSNKFR